MGLNRLSLPVVVMMMINAMILSQGCLEEERIALLQIKTSFGLDDSSSYPQSSWGKDTLFCSWYGVTCSNSTTRRVVEIHLFFARDGYSSMGDLYLNASIFLPFQELKVLVLDGNRIAGCVANEEIDSLSELEVLSLSGNTIHNFSKSRENTGFSNLSVLYLDYVTSEASVSILQSLSAFPNLKALSLQDNYNPYGFGQGELPNLKFLERLDLTESSLVNYNFLQTVGKFTSLKSLVLPYSGLSGPIFAPHGLCELKHLQELDISHNDLSGSLPSCLSNLTNLQALNISFNNFTGNTSLSSIGSLASIQILRLSDNHFKIPISLGPFFNLSKLKYLFGDRNEIYESTELVHNLIPRFQLQSLSLACNGSGGTFSKFLFYQHDLQFVYLSHIKMTGEFPSWLLQNNTKLEVLYLVKNSFSGCFQLANHSFMSLSYLDISRNRIHNQIPTEIGACFPRLVFLNLSRNDFNGSIPSSISNMSLLEVLDLSNNGLSSNIPEQLVEGCLSLGVLMLSNNHLKGQLFWKNVNLKYLTDLILRGNQLTGILLNSLSNCSALEALDVSLNNLSGKIPRWIRNMSSLQYLDLLENNILGSLPSSFCSSGMMTEVYLSKNKLEGSLIGTLDGCLSLKRLDLSHNYFRGGIPKSIGSLLEFSFLLLGYNNLEAEIPRQLCKLKKLSLIDLSHNNLSGRILPCLHPRSEWYWKWESAPGSTTPPAPGSSTMPPALVAAQPSPPPQSPMPLEDRSVNRSVEITTKSISYLYNGIILNLISGIDFSCNNLTGEIPFELGNLSNIKLLNLSHNSLTGPIPPTFSNLKEIETLDLSYNNLNGEIPPQLIDLYSLSAFSVAHNNLSGKTPEMVAQFSTFNESCYEGNPLLCGPPLAKNCTGGIPPSPLPRSQNHKKEENGVIDMEAFYVTFSVAYIMVLLAIGAVLYINPQWRQAWFYFIGESINNCYYFLVDNLPVSVRFKRFQPCV
ncbi:cuscuta receptor 1-like [Populus alba]|uniref:cuscuta receptor 1-like n=1 Tax=Populus alba TaxID=43335 RepID=UPI003CC6FB66